MTSRAVVPLSLSIALFAAAHAAAESERPAFFSGAKLIKACTVQETPVDAGVCFGYIFGAMDMAASSEVSDAKMWCFPDNLSGSDVMGQSAASVQSYLKGHPDSQELTGVALVSAALKEAFPCSGASRSQTP